jgi:hypothetical protein
MADHHRYLPYIREDTQERFNRSDPDLPAQRTAPDSGRLGDAAQDDRTLTARIIGALYRDLHDLELARIGRTPQDEGLTTGP